MIIYGNYNCYDRKFSNITRFIIRVIPRFLAWLVKRRYKIYLRVGHISLPYFILRDVNVSKNGFTLVSYIIFTRQRYSLVINYTVANFN